MAPKNPRQPTKEEQKREESSDEENSEEETESGETEEGSSEEEEEEEEKENQVTAKPYKPQTLVSNSESKSKSDSKSKPKSRVSDSEAESDGSPSDYKLQPIVKPTASSPTKRAHQEREEGEDVSRSSKKAKTGEKEKVKEEDKKNSGSTPGGVIARVWSDEDEIAVLNGMIDFRKAKGHDYNSEEIYNFMKGKLQGDFSKLQLRTKINRMKNRFLNALKKSSDPVFSKPHDDMAFELSKKIWVDEAAAAANGSVAAKNGNSNANSKKKDVVKNGKKETVKAEVEEKEKDDDGDDEGEFWTKYPYLSSSFLNMRGNSPSLSISEASVSLLKEKVSLIGESKANELNQKWRQLFLEELELNNRMLALMKEQTQLGLNQMSDS